MNTLTTRLSLSIIVCSTLLLLGGCLQPRGHLVIVGGGLDDNNRLIHERFVALAGGKDAIIGVIPIASGDGLKAGEEVAQRWRQWGPKSVIVIPLTKDDAAKANDPEIGDAIASCTAIWFTGGDQSRIINVLKPEGRWTGALSSIESVLRSDGVIGGTSAGAAIMSDPMILGGASADTKSADPDNPSSSRVRTGPGLGFFAAGLVDQHFLQRNRMGRLIDALQDTNTRWGYGISENCAMIVNIPDASIEAIGPRGVCVIDARENPPLVRVLSTGDRINVPRKRTIR